MERDIDKLVESTLSIWDNSPNAKVPANMPNKVLQRIAAERKRTQRTTYMVAAASLVLVGLNVAVMLNVVAKPAGANMASELNEEQTLLKQMQQEYFGNDSYGVVR